MSVQELLQQYQPQEEATVHRGKALPNWNFSTRQVDKMKNGADYFISVGTRVV
jgi:hypothetical protein